MLSPIPPSLPAGELDRRLIALARSHQRLEASLCFHLQELDERALYSTLGFSSTVHYAKERLGFDEKKTRALLRMAIKFKALPRLGEAFSKGELPWTKVREAIKVATAETEEDWIQKCRELSNRQIEREVRRQEGPVRKKTVVFVLEGDQVETWEQVREALERLSGKSLTDIETFELMCAEVLCTYAATPPFGCGEEDSEAGGYARLIAERDGWVCARAGCGCRVGLQAHHIVSRAKGGSDEIGNTILVCALCHGAITRGQIWVRGRAPDALVWGAPWGIIEKPVPLSRERDFLREGSASSTTETTRNETSGPWLFVRETEHPYRSGSGIGPEGEEQGSRGTRRARVAGGRSGQVFRFCPPGRLPQTKPDSSDKFLGLHVSKLTKARSTSRLKPSITPGGSATRSPARFISTSSWAREKP